MKQTLLFQIALIIITSFWGCDSSTETETINSQVMFFYAEHRDSYWDGNTNLIIEEEIATGFGIIFSDPIPSFEYYKLGDITYSSEDYYDYFPGYLRFGPLENNTNEMITTNLNPLSLEVKTSLGKLTGSIELPNRIDSLILSEYSNLPLGEPFTINWTGSDADFYNVYCSYSWIDDDENWHNTNLNDFVSDDSITYPDSIFIHNGEIAYIRVIPMNGPLPKAGAKGNMSGEGSGFFYYNIEEARHDGESIIVGSGLGKLAKKSNTPINERNITEIMRVKLEKEILTNM